MKLQFQAQRLRLRIEEAELAALRRGATIENAIRLGAIAWRLTVRQSDAATPSLHSSPGGCAIEIPATLVDAYASRLPCREGLGFSLQPPGEPPIDLVLEVDVRDSVRTRGPRRP